VLKLFVLEVSDKSQPRAASEKHAVKQLKLGDDILLPCIAQGYPVPTYRYAPLIFSEWGSHLNNVFSIFFKVLRLRIT